MERTYVRGRDQCEVMDASDHVYAYRDNLPAIPGVGWIAGQNPLFRYADRPDIARRYLAEHFDLIDD